MKVGRERGLDISDRERGGGNFSLVIRWGMIVLISNGSCFWPGRGQLAQCVSLPTCNISAYDSYRGWKVLLFDMAIFYAFIYFDFDHCTPQLTPLPYINFKWMVLTYLYVTVMYSLWINLDASLFNIIEKATVLYSLLLLCYIALSLIFQQSCYFERRLLHCLCIKEVVCWYLFC